MAKEPDPHSFGAAYGFKPDEKSEHGNAIIELIMRGNLVQKEGPTCLTFLPNAPEQIHAYVDALLNKSASCVMCSGEFHAEMPLICPTCRVSITMDGIFKINDRLRAENKSLQDQLEACKTT